VDISFGFNSVDGLNMVRGIFIKLFILLCEAKLRIQAYWSRAYLETLQRRGAKIGSNVFAENLSVEENFSDLLRIEDDVVLADGVRILLHDSSLNNVCGLPVKFGKVTIRKGAYIGARTTILPGVEIGQGTIVGAGSLVTKDIPPNSVAYGIPARVIGSTESLKERFLEEMNKSQPNSYFYLDIPPWRERYHSYHGSEVIEKYKGLLSSIKDDQGKIEIAND
jgi:acetyltransferase-like isoleucine patch superfamily enzyme